MAVNKAWIAIAWLLSIAAFPACATSDETTTGSASSSGSTSGAGGAGGGTDGGADGSDGSDVICGDGKLATTESCDDGNAADGDGCSATCAFEKGWSCSGEPAKCSAICGDGLLLGDEECDDSNAKKSDGCNIKCHVEEGWTCDTASPTKCFTTCGDAVIAGKEECDDGNLELEDGCNTSCIVEQGFSCVGVPSHCNAQCGDGIISKGEQCDDDNFASNDGCSSECKSEDHWSCMGAPSVCSTPCGDGLIVGKETCDDGNSVDGDGCSAACAAEPGWTCEGEPSACLTGCGDGAVAGIEQCDDGNEAGNDGCSINCKVEPGWSCNQQSPNVCVTACGDGFPTGNEACDDGNKVNGDGCSAACQIEVGYICVSIPSTCITLCGDGLIAGAEQCDDANAENDDGCDLECKIQSGWSCTTPPGVPTECISTCGDGIAVGVEVCDDGNKVSGDCCTDACEVEPVCELETNNDSETSNDFDTLSEGGLIKGNIKPVGDTDFFSVSVPPDTVAALSAETIDGVNSACVLNSLDSTINVYAPDGLTQLGTSDDGNGTDPGSCAALIVGGLEGGPSGAEYYVEVLSSAANKTFDYSLKMTIKITICGDGIKDPGEQCDDSNTANGDGCNSSCIFETYSEIEPNGNKAEADTNGAFPINSIWTGTINPVGDNDIYRIDLTNTVDLRIETFEGAVPGNCTGIDTEINLLSSNGTTALVTDDDDGVGACSLIDPKVDSGARQLHPGTYYINMHRYFNSAVIPSYVLLATPTSLCGNGVKEGFEPCDGTPNCSPTCDVVPVCGDGTVNSPEQCDDGNTTSGDGCSSTCEIELPPPVCGDGTVAGAELCDDGNTTSGDGCSGACQLEGLPALEVEPNSTFAQADLLPAFSTSTLLGGSIGVVGDKDIFRIAVTTASVIRFENFQDLAGNCPGISTTLRLFDAGGGQIKTDSPDSAASGIGNCAALSVALDPGSYYIQVERTGNSSTIPLYVFEMVFETSLGNEAEPNDTPAQANTLNGTDVFVFGNHQVTADVDYYAITIPAGKSIRAELIEGDAALVCEGIAIDSLITLYNAAATSLVSDDDDGRGRCSAIDGTGATPRDAPAHNLAAGTYYLEAKAYTTTNSQFNYRLVITIR